MKSELSKCFRYTEETNMAIWDYLIKMMTDDDFKFKSYDFGDIDINDNRMVPDTIFLAEQGTKIMAAKIQNPIPPIKMKIFFS